LREVTFSYSAWFGFIEQPSPFAIRVKDADRILQAAWRI